MVQQHVSDRMVGVKKLALDFCTKRKTKLDALVYCPVGPGLRPGELCFLSIPRKKGKMEPYS